MNWLQTPEQIKLISPEPTKSSAFHFDTDDQTCHLFEMLSGPPRRRRENDANKLPLVEAERLITEDLYKLNLKEREGALHDIHGVSDSIQETEEFVQEHLNQLHMELQLPRYTNNSSCEAYQLARQQSPCYVASLYQLFLRSQSYCVSKAADLMMRHFDLKRDVFGVAALGRPVTLAEDFDEFDLESLRAGYFQVLPHRDRSGRAILFAALNRYTYRSINSFLKVLWYIRMVALQDEETQKKGFVSVTWCDTIPTNVDARILIGMKRMRHGLPMRSAAIHHCYSDPAFGNIIRWFTLSMLECKSRPRTRLHHGSLIEARYEIMSFGIPPSSIPMNPDGTLQLGNHLKFLQSRRAQEERFRRRRQTTCSGGASSSSSDEEDDIVVPSSMDVLFERGTLKHRNVGTMNLFDLYEERAVAYSNARKLEKPKIALEMVRTLRERQGARFLVKEEDDCTWTQVDDKTACKKICQEFRNRRQTKLLNTRTRPIMLGTTANNLPPPSTEKRRKVSSSSSSTLVGSGGSSNTSIPTHSLGAEPVFLDLENMIAEKTDASIGGKRPRILWENETIIHGDDDDDDDDDKPYKV